MRRVHGQPAFQIAQARISLSTGCPVVVQRLLVAHELGHQFGLFDEYISTANNNGPRPYQRPVAPEDERRRLKVACRTTTFGLKTSTQATKCFVRSTTKHFASKETNPEITYLAKICVSEDFSVV